METENVSLVEPKVDSRLAHGIWLVSGLLVLIALIISGMTLHKVNANDLCSYENTVVTTYPMFDTITSMDVADPVCGGMCNKLAATNQAKADASWYVFDALVGEVRSVYDNMTGTYTLLSSNLGAVNAIEPILCNLTAITNVTYTVFQYYSNTKAFERVVTTVPQTNGMPALCSYMSNTSAAYKAVTVGNTYIGTTTLFGVLYNAVYAPIYDAVTNELIGSLFAGYA